MNSQVPHLRVVIAACIAAVAGYMLFSVYAVMWLRDATMIGDIIGTWKSFAVLAFGFWLGSSSAGKAKDGPPPEDAKEAADQVAGAAEREAERIGDRP